MDKSNGDAELLAKARELGIDTSKYTVAGTSNKAKSQPQANLKSFDSVMDEYENPDVSYSDYITSAVPASLKGIREINNKVAMNLGDTAASILNSVGLVSDKGLETWKGKSEAFLNRNDDDEAIRKFPGLYKNTRDLGALGTEIGGAFMTGNAAAGAAKGLAAAQKATPLVKGGLGVLNEMIQGGAVSALEAKNNKASAFGAGAVLTAPFSIAGKAISAGLNKALTNGKEVSAVSQSFNEVSKASAETGISTSLGQKTGSYGLRQAEEAYREVPLFGTNSFFNKQYNQTGAAIDQVLKTANTSLREASAPGAAQKSAKTVANAFDKGYEWVKQQGYDAYDNVFKHTNIVVAPDEAIAKATSLKLPLASVQKVGIQKDLINLMSAVQNLKQSKPSDILKVRKGFDEIMDRVDKLGKKGDLSEEIVNATHSIRQSLENGLHRAAKRAGTLDGYLKAKDFWRNNVVPMKESRIEMAQGSNGVPKLLNILSDPGKTTTASKIMSSLQEEGRAAVRTHIATNSVQRAVNAKGYFDTNTFLKMYQEDLARYSLKPTAKDKNIIQGINRIMETSKGIGITEKAPHVLGGGLAGGAILSVGGVANPGIAGMMAGLAKGLTLLSTTEAGQKLIMGMARIPVGSAKAQTVVNSIIEGLRTANITAAASYSDNVVNKEQQ